MTQDEKVIWAAVYAATHVELVGPYRISESDLEIAVDVADSAVRSLRKRVQQRGSVHRNKEMSMETKYTTPVEGLEL